MTRVDDQRRIHSAFLASAARPVSVRSALSYSNSTTDSSPVSVSSDLDAKISSSVGTRGGGGGVGLDVGWGGGGGGVGVCWTTGGGGAGGGAGGCTGGFLPHPARPIV